MQFSQWSLFAYVCSAILLPCINTAVAQIIIIVIVYNNYEKSSVAIATYLLLQSGFVCWQEYFVVTLQVPSVLGECTTVVCGLYNLNNMNYFGETDCTHYDNYTPLIVTCIQCLAMILFTLYISHEVRIVILRPGHNIIPCVRDPLLVSFVLLYAGAIIRNHQRLVYPIQRSTENIAEKKEGNKSASQYLHRCCKNPLRFHLAEIAWRAIIYTIWEAQLYGFFLDPCLPSPLANNDHEV